MDINTADSLLNTDCLIPINRDGKEFYYWKIDLPPSLQEEVRLKILGEKLANISPGRRNEFKKQTKKDFGADFYHTNSRQIYYGNKLALEHILGSNSIRKIMNFLKCRIVEMYNFKFNANINQNDVICDLITIIRAMPNQVDNYLILHLYVTFIYIDFFSTFVICMAMNINFILASSLNEHRCADAKLTKL